MSRNSNNCTLLLSGYENICYQKVTIQTFVQLSKISVLITRQKIIKNLNEEQRFHRKLLYLSLFCIKSACVSDNYSRYIIRSGAPLDEIAWEYIGFDSLEEKRITSKSKDGIRATPTHQETHTEKGRNIYNASMYLYTHTHPPEVEIDISVWVWFVVPVTSHRNNACTRCEVSDVYSTSTAFSMSTSQFPTQTMRRSGEILGSKDSLV